MAHNLYYDERKGQHAFFSVSQKAWHGLGQIVSDYPTSSEAIRFAGLDYRVEKRPLFTPDKEHLLHNADTAPAGIKVPHHFATVRTDTDTVLGVVGKEYEVVQNRDAFSFFDAIVSGDGMQYETAGALGKGERIFITAKLPGYLRVGGDDLIEKYLFLTTSHDGFGSITAAFTPVRIVCANTLRAALHNRSHTVKIRHTMGAKERLQTAHQVMGITDRLSTELERVLNRWAKVRITDKELLKLIQLAMVPNREVLKDLQAGLLDECSARYKGVCEATFAYAMTHPTQQDETSRGTLFGAYNAVTGYFQNVRTYRDEEAKLRSILLGGTAEQRSQKAFNLCTHFEASGSETLFLN